MPKRAFRIALPASRSPTVRAVIAWWTTILLVAGLAWQPFPHASSRADRALGGAIGGTICLAHDDQSPSALEADDCADRGCCVLSRRAVLDVPMGPPPAQPQVPPSGAASDAAGWLVAPVVPPARLAAVRGWARGPPARVA